MWRRLGTLLVSATVTWCGAACDRKKTAPRPPSAQTPAPDAGGRRASGPRAVVERAIRAHGGLAALKAKVSQFTGRSKGTWYGRAFQLTQYWRAPDQLVMAIDTAQGSTRMGYVSGRCWTQIRDVVAACEKGEAAGFRRRVALVHLSNLYPLVEPQTKATLATAPGATVAGKATTGVLVKSPDGVEAVFHFYRDSGLLAQVTYDTAMLGRKHRQVITMLEYLPIDGVQMPRRSESSIAGKRILVDEHTGYQLGRAAASRFRPPPQAKLGHPRVHQLPATTIAYYLHRGPRAELAEGLAKLIGWLKKRGVAPQGKPILTYLAPPPQARTRLAFAVSPRLDPVEDGPLGITRLPARQAAISVERGDYAKLGPRFRELRAWVRQRGWRVQGPRTLIAYSDPRRTKPPEQVAEILFEIAK